MSALLAAGIAALFVVSPAASLESGQTGPESHLEAPRPLTAEVALETARFMDDEVSVSPDGRTFVIRQIRGDVALDGYWLELLAGNLSSVQTARQVKVVARMFSSGLGRKDSLMSGPDRDSDGFRNPLRWLGNDRVAFLWSDRNAVRQIVTVDLSSGAVSQVTHAEQPVVSFDMAGDGTLVYNELVGGSPDPDRDLVKEGFTIPDSINGFDVLERRFNGPGGLDAGWNSKWVVRAARGPLRPLRLGHNDIDIGLPYARTLSIAPDSQIAIVSGMPMAVPDDWDAYDERHQRTIISEMRRDPKSFRARRAIQLYLVDIVNATAKPLWSASAPLNGRAIWAPDSKSVLLVPTFLPVRSAGPEGLSGRAAAVVDIRTGQYSRLPITLPPWNQLASIRAKWRDARTIEIGLDDPARAQNEVRVFRLRGDTWVPEGPPTSGAPGNSSLRLEIHEDLQTPPRLFAVNVLDGHAELIYDPNPNLTEKFALGRVELLSGKLETGTKWQALLFYPVGERAAPYPLVIQSSGGGIVANRFTLSGWQRGRGGLGPPPIAVMVAQLLAQRQIAVATVSVADATGAREGPSSIEAYEAVARRLIDSGLVDGRKVALSGFSRPGYRVLYTLTHSSFPYAAAIAVDNFDPSYMQTSLRGWSADGEHAIGAPAFGPGLLRWLTEAPGYNAERVSAPLLMVGQSPSAVSYIMASWEMFSRLRYLNKPVEMYLMPDIDDHPSHTPQNPRQILALQRKVLDWFDFWLNSAEDPEPGKREQYSRWRNLQAQHLKALKH